MRLLKKYILLIFTISIFTGCTATFNPYNKGVTFTSGKPYRVPYGVWVQELRADDKSKLTEALHKWKIAECKIGDVIWIEENYDKKMDILKTQKDWFNYWKYGFKNLLVGCTSPMTDKEFYYYTGKERQTRQLQHEQNIQAQKNLNESLNNLPKTYNVNVYNH